MSTPQSSKITKSGSGGEATGKALTLLRAIAAGADVRRISGPAHTVGAVGQPIRPAQSPSSNSALLSSLVAAGLAQWQKTGDVGQFRLELTHLGRAAVQRADGFAGVDPFLAQHANLARRVVDTHAAPVLVNDSESPLAWLARRKGRDGHPMIDAVAFAAGERFRADVTLAQMLPRTTANWSAVAGRASGGSIGLTYSDLLLAARQRVEKAVDAIGPELSGVIIDICGFLKGLEVVEKERGWPQRSAKIVLDIGLQRLAHHYGFAGSAVGKTRNSSIAHWGAPDYRPAIGTGLSQAAE